jgi:6-pyruvoyltetrahydropterin/6-carboxytetrahydropterin synthase
MTVFPNGVKERLHGHNYTVRVTLELLQVSFSTMIDFGIVRRALEALCEEWNDHLMLAEKCPGLSITRRDEREVEFVMVGKRYVIPADEVIFLPVENVIVETLSVLIAERLVERLAGVIVPEVVGAVEVEVSEIRGLGGTYRWTWPARAE